MDLQVVGLQVVDCAVLSDYKPKRLPATLPSLYFGACTGVFLSQLKGLHYIHADRCACPYIQLHAPFLSKWMLLLFTTSALRVVWQPVSTRHDWC